MKEEKIGGGGGGVSYVEKGLNAFLQQVNIQLYRYKNHYLFIYL